MIRFLNSVIASLIFTSTILQAEEIVQQPLFTIERNKNANIVQYDVRITQDGALDRKEPVAAYWIRLAEEGQTKELSWIQKTFAYGVTAKVGKDRTSAELKLKADIGRPINVHKEGEQYRATATIDGVQAYIEKIFIHASGKGMSTTVEFIDLRGISLSDGVDVHERIEP
jgi:hypothetical protein